MGRVDLDKLPYTSESIWALTGLRDSSSIKQIAWRCCQTASQGLRRCLGHPQHMQTGCTCAASTTACVTIRSVSQNWSGHSHPLSAHAVHSVHMPCRTAYSWAPKTASPVALPSCRQVQRLGDLSCAHGARQVLLVRQHQHHSTLREGRLQSIKAHETCMAGGRQPCRRAGTLQGRGFWAVFLCVQARHAMQHTPR